MPDAFMVSSLLSAIACLGLAGFATTNFMAESDDCLNQPTVCIGQSVSRSHNAVTKVLSNWN